MEQKPACAQDSSASFTLVLQIGIHEYCNSITHFDPLLNMALLNILHELGLHSLHNSPQDTKILILQRFIRFFAFGGSTIVLALYLHAIAIPDAQIGLFMSLTLVGDVISFGLTLFADGVGRKIVLGGGALLMVMSGVVFAFTGNFWCLLAASVFGVISPKYAPLFI